MGVVFEEDLNDEFIWTTRETVTDDNGILLGRLTVFDNEVERSETFEGGTLTYQQDIDGGQDAKPWQSLEQYYDQTGEIQAKIELRDNDILIESVYQDGVLSNKVWTDDATTDAAGWQRVEEYYDTNGQRAARIELRDNDVLIESVYQDGVISNRSWTDNAETDATNWQQIEEYYDSTGERVARIELRDDGVTITNEYQDGVLQVRTQQDDAALNAKSWDTSTSYYDPSGQLAARETVYDNADVTAMIYEDGVRSIRLQFDGDDSNPWLVRETLYDAAGQVAEINTYDTAEEVPSDYGFWDWTA